jgi:hypothetical protein
MGMLPDQVDPGDLGPGPWRWLVTWGALLRPNWHAEVVEAFDVDEALEVARTLRPDLPPPRVAILARQDDRG